jgi:hypothetical protein
MATKNDAEEARVVCETISLTSAYPRSCVFAFLTLALADHGAEVIKIESPEGDAGRHIGLSDGLIEAATMDKRNSLHGVKQREVEEVQHGCNRKLTWLLNCKQWREPPQQQPRRAATNNWLVTQ